KKNVPNPQLNRTRATAPVSSTLSGNCLVAELARLIEEETMANGTDAVRQRYPMRGLLDRVISFLLERGIDPEHPTYQDFFPFDQLHGRGIEATREHI